MLHSNENIFKSLLLTLSNEIIYIFCYTKIFIDDNIIKLN